MSITQQSIKPYIMLLAIVLGLAVPIVMWFADKSFPPLLFIIFISLGLTCIIHSVLGGTEVAQFKLAAITLSGGAAVLIGAVWLLNPILERQMLANAASLRQADHAKDISSLNQLLQEAEKEKATLSQSLISSREELNEAKRNLLSTALVQVKGLRRGHPVADALVEMALRREGPWEPTSEEIQIKVSVAGYLTGRNAAVCKQLNFRGKKVDITSVLVESGQYYRSEQPISIDSWSLISDQVCDAERKFDVQVGCQLAEEIFTTDVIRCSGRQAAWQGQFKNILPAAAVVIYE